MIHKIINKFKTLHLLVMAVVLFSCGDKNEPQPTVSQKKTVLLYAIASNGLDIESDKNEILMAADNMDIDGLSMLVYEVTTNMGEPPALSQVEKDKNGKAFFKVIKEYDRDLYSTDPKRVSQVVTDVRSLRPADSYGMIFWGHGSGLDPENSKHPAKSGDDSSRYIVPIQHAFGYDVDKDKDYSHRDWIDIDELAEALPDGMFDYIWFDVCYMSNIETVYQLRDKCRYYIGYPTEVGQSGMPYDLTLPYLLGDSSDLVEGAKQFFNYYKEGRDPFFKIATVAVLDMSKIEDVADACRAIYSNSEDISSNGILYYTRNGIGPFYDLGGYSERKAKANADGPDMESFNKAMSEFVVWKAATDRGFNNLEMTAENYSGVSCHLFSSAASDKKTEFYKTLDWYDRVY